MIISEWVHTPSNIHVFPWNRKYKNVQDWFTKNWYIYANCNRIWVCFYFLSLWRCFSNPLGMSFLALAAATSLGSTTWGGGQAGAWGMLGSDFYAIGLIIYIKHSILNLLINFFGCVNKCLFYICCCFGRGLHEDQAMFPGKSLPLLFFHVSSCL